MSGGAFRERLRRLRREGDGGRTAASSTGGPPAGADPAETEPGTGGGPRGATAERPRAARAGGGEPSRPEPGDPELAGAMPGASAPAKREWARGVSTELPPLPAVPAEQAQDGRGGPRGPGAGAGARGRTERVNPGPGDPEPAAAMPGASAHAQREWARGVSTEPPPPPPAGPAEQAQDGRSGPRGPGAGAGATGRTERVNPGPGEPEPAGAMPGASASAQGEWSRGVSTEPPPPPDGPAEQAQDHRSGSRGSGAGAGAKARVGARGGGMPSWLRRRLERRPGRRPAAGPAAGTAPSGAQVGPGAGTASPGAPGAPGPPEAPGVATMRGLPADLAAARGERGEYALRATAFDPEHRHGDWALAEVDAVERDVFPLLTRDGALAGLELRRAVYLDIETTGLAGGAGTIPFLVGLGRFEEDGRFHLWQGFLRAPAEEPALLEEVARRVGAAASVVSFFGKSFDRHRLEDKMRIHRVEPPFAGRPHLDLYHPCSRLYRRALPDGRLATMERALCGVERGDDLPGSFAPAAWIDFLKGRPHRLEAVFRHNADDVLSLVTLAAHLGRARTERRAGGGELPGHAYARALGLADLHGTRARRAEELRWLERALTRASAPTPRSLLLRRADVLRLARRPAEALAAYRELAAQAADAHAARAWCEIAKLLEHAERDYAAALDACARARELAEAHLSGSAFARACRDLERRRARLARRGGA